MQKLRKWAARLALLSVLLAGVLLSWAYWQLRASLPVLDGVVAIAGLDEEVSVTRDEVGMVAISANSRTAVARAMGFVHAQERFFQMDLMRRQAAGELSALLGGAALEFDQLVRIHQLRARARVIAGQLAEDQSAILQAYVDGVNAGLHGLAAKPFEYWLLHAEPVAWTAEDSILAAYSMYLVLQPSTPEKKLTRMNVKERVPESLYAFLRAKGSEWDAPLWGKPLLPPSIPEESSLANWSARLELPLKNNDRLEPVFPGSNSWAVSGELSDNGSAILHNDMHLKLRVPNIWFRMQIRYGEDEPSGGRYRHQVTGVSLPGAPLVVVGSNGKVAWGYTNSYGDFSDVIILEQARPGSYLTPNGEYPLETVVETIDVKGAPARRLAIEKTIWGPVAETGADGRKFVFKWLAHDVTQAIDFGILALETTENVADAIRVANRARLPSQNILLVDSDGNLAWTIIGAIPRRVGCDGEEPVSFADGSCSWQGYLADDEYPLLLNPPEGRLWTANNRVASGEMLRRIGDGGYDLGARARQIRDDLFARESFAEHDLLAIALDDRGLFLARWKEHLERLLADESVLQDDVGKALLVRLKSEEALRARRDSVAYRVVRAYRYMLRDTLFTAWLSAAYAAQPDLKIGSLSNQWEGVLWEVIEKKPAHLLPAPFASWGDFEREVLKATLLSLGADNKERLAELTWGARNTAAIEHPLSRFIPLVGSFLNAPVEAVDGDANMPRVAAPSFGSSQRMVVSPGHEERAIFHMPGGQSGHPLSPYYLAGHEAWVKGEATPFLPQATQHELTLVPQVSP
ncbi:MAG TPA: penicillin acylase family protein [Accumulibacter sp.]|nr:penicillin acylase family protein [Accumulibacter sp.]